ncbi:Histone H2A.Z-specific chaperone CHZ1 [Marasmius crinis-equi]|uniref:Histone H2A.Z-specific chaperone CHZ1 n=1 Tax=Marasmius crinis-equi TaxID=585013 RepID=A0ABR3G232_9AGAR
MSTDATTPSSDVKNAATNPQSVDASAEAKGKGKAKDTTEDVSMDDDEDDEDDDDDDDDEEEDDDDEEEDSLEEINPEVIVGRRTRGNKVDYTSAEALAKAGLKQGDAEDDEDEDAKMKD